MIAVGVGKERGMERLRPDVVGIGPYFIRNGAGRALQLKCRREGPTFAGWTQGRKSFP
jgi:hypothetical protein